jgi:hypothetical protein
MRSAGCTSARNWIPAVPSRTVTHRLNAFLHVLAPLHDLGLTEADPGSVTTPGSIVPGPPACGQKDAADA